MSCFISCSLPLITHSLVSVLTFLIPNSPVNQLVTLSWYMLYKKSFSYYSSPFCPSVSNQSHAAADWLCCFLPSLLQLAPPLRSYESLVEFTCALHIFSFSVIWFAGAKRFWPTCVTMVTWWQSSESRKETNFHTFEVHHSTKINIQITDSWPWRACVHVNMSVGNRLLTRVTKMVPTKRLYLSTTTKF